MERAIERQTIPLLLTLLTPSGSVHIRVLFAILPGSGNLIILGQMMLRELLCVDLMDDLKRMVTANCSGRGNGMERTCGDANELLGIVETWGKD